MTTRSRAAVAVAAALVVIALGLHWWTHPTLFSDLGDGYGSMPLPVEDAALSSTVIYPQIKGDPETITIKDLSATFSTNTAGAAATFSICHMGATEDPIGMVHDPGSVCSDLDPAGPGSDFRYGVAPDSDYLVVTVTPSQPGVAHLESVRIDYRREANHLFQQGSQTILADRTIPVT